MRDWYFMPPPGFSGVLNQWVVTLDGAPSALRQVPNLIVRQEPVRVRLPKEVTRLTAAIDQDVDGSKVKTFVQFVLQENPHHA